MNEQNSCLRVCGAPTVYMKLCCAAYAAKVQAESPVVDRWNAYMQDVLELEMDPKTGAQKALVEVFRLE